VSIDFTYYLIGLLGIAALFGVAVTIHEFGHFIAAKFFGVRVERFSVGMGKIIWSKQWGDTEYALSLLPIGGYVKLTGHVSKDVESAGDLLDAQDNLKAHEALRDYLQNPKPTYSASFLAWLAAAGTFGVMGLLHDDPYAKLGLPLVGLALALWALIDRYLGLRALRALRLSDIEAKISEAREHLTELQAKLGVTNPEKALNEAAPGLGEMAREDEQKVNALIEDNLALRAKPLHAKLIIFAGGCAMNVLLAYAVLVGILTFGYSEDVPTGTDIEGGRPGYPLAKYDIRDGDKVTAVNGVVVKSWDDLYDEITKAALVKGDVTLQLELGEASIAAKGPYPDLAEGVTPEAWRTKSVTIPWSEPTELTGTPPEGTPDIRMDLYRGPAYLFIAPFDAVLVGEITPNGPAEKAGLAPRDRIVSIDGEPIGTWAQLVERVEASAGKPLAFQYERAGKTVETSVTPRMEDGTGKIGVIRGFAHSVDCSEPFGVAAKLALYEIGIKTQQYLKGLWRLVTGQEDNALKKLSGVVSIGQIAARKANQGWHDYLFFFAVINLVLAIMNLLPIPLLDGGHIVISLIESVRRAPIPAKVLLGVYQVAMYAVMGLAAFLLANDIFQNSWRYFGWLGGLIA